MSDLSKNARLMLAAYQKMKMEGSRTGLFEVTKLAGLTHDDARSAIHELERDGLIGLEGDLG